MGIDPEIMTLLRRIAEALERIAPAPSASVDQVESLPHDADAYRVLRHLNVREPHLSKLAGLVTVEQVMAWRCYLLESDLAPEHRTGYMIRRLYAGDTPPSEYEQLLARYVPLEYEDSIDH